MNKMHLFALFFAVLSFDVWSYESKWCKSEEFDKYGKLYCEFMYDDHAFENDIAEITIRNAFRSSGDGRYRDLKSFAHNRCNTENPWEFPNPFCDKGHNKNFEDACTQINLEGSVSYVKCEWRHGFKGRKKFQMIVDVDSYYAVSLKSSHGVYAYQTTGTLVEVGLFGRVKREAGLICLYYTGINSCSECNDGKWDLGCNASPLPRP